LLIASAGGDGVAKLWDERTGAEIRTLTGHTDRVTGIAFGPDGLCIATASEDQTVSLWDVRTGAELHTFLGHARRVNAVAFSPLNGVLASGSDDGTVKIWSTVDIQGEKQLVSGQPKLAMPQRCTSE
jgi:WD40 repeat protein